MSERTGARATSYSWTARNQLASVTDAGGKVSFGYDGLGRAVMQTSRSLLSSDRALSVFDGLVPVGEDSSVSGVRSLVRDVTGDVAIQSTVRPGVLGTGLLGGVDTRWGLTDRLGSTVGQGQGSRISQLASYSVWGVFQPVTTGWDSVTGFTGELGGITTGLWSFYARSYDPVAGTWLQADSYRGVTADPGTLARYQYVTGNPSTYTDAYGYRIDAQGGSRLALDRGYRGYATGHRWTNQAPTVKAPSGEAGLISVRHSAAPSLGETIATFPGEVVVGFLLSAYDSLVSIWDLSPFKYGLISLTDGPQAGVGAAAVKAIEFINAYHQAERDPGGAALAVLGNAFAADQWGTNSGQALGRSIFTVATLATGAGGALKGISALKATAAAAKTATGSIKAPPFGAASVTGEVGQVLSRTDLNPAQFSNFSRYVRKLPAAAEPTVITRGPDGSVHLSTKVPGRVPGSYATYDKVVDGSGATIGYTKTTVDPNGSVVHVKDKFP